jgi:hypothetical protein
VRLGAGRLRQPAAAAAAGDAAPPPGGGALPAAVSSSAEAAAAQEDDEKGRRRALSVLIAVAVSCAVAGALAGAALITARALRARYSRMSAAAPLLVPATTLSFKVATPRRGSSGALARVAPADEPPPDLEMATWTAATP